MNKTAETIMNSSKIDGIISVMNQLCAFLKKENEILEKNKVSEVEKLVTPKTKLINLYTEQYNLLSRNPEIMQELDGIRREELRQIAARLQELMERNGRLLSANINSTRRLIDIIVKEVQNQENEQSGVYSSTGNLGHERAKRSSLTYNQVL